VPPDLRGGARLIFLDATMPPHMIDWTWFTADASSLVMILLTGVGVYAALLALTRLTGLRSFSKMSSFDFAITVAIGSIIASTLLAKTPSLAAGAFGLAVLYGIQWTVSKARRENEPVERLVDNEPLLVMAGETVLSEHLDATRMTLDDLRSKLRRKGVTHPKQVLAVVFETTGDVSVLQHRDAVSAWTFENVRGAEHLEPLLDEEGGSTQPEATP
jgi:uncharacterized membrane protein YcaP (DUF421 family)